MPSMPTTSWPSARRRAARWKPMKPAVPVTRMRIGQRTFGRRRGAAAGSAAYHQPDDLVAVGLACAALAGLDATPEHDDAVGHGKDVAEIVRDEDDALAARLQGLDQGNHLALLGDAERG